jgi:hypothetical protein
VRCRIREIGVFNTTATAVSLKIVRLTTAGTPGTSQTVDKLDPADPSANVGAFRTTYSSTAPTITDTGFRVTLNGAIGAGFVWTWEDFEFTTAVAANAGIGIVVESGTGQAIMTYWKWRE